MELSFSESIRQESVEMSHLLNKFADKLQGHDHDEGENKDREQEEDVTQHQRGIRSGTRRKQESEREELYSGTSQGYEGIPSEDTGAYMHSGNTGRDRDSSRAETKLGSAGGDMMGEEEADADTFTSGQGQRARRGMAKDWSEESGSYTHEQSGTYGSGSGMGSGNEGMMGSNRRGGNW